MKILKAIQERLQRHRVWWHWINDNDKPGGETGHIARHGRLVVHFGNNAVRLSWNHGASFAHAYVNVGGEEDVTVGVALPPVAYWISLARLPRAVMAALPMNYLREERRYANTRRVGLSIYDWAIWWDGWSDEGEWRARDPKWMHGCWHPLDAVFGQHAHSERVIEERDVSIPMPERQYPARVKMSLETWARPRWPFWPMRTEVKRAHVDIPGGIGMPGKGENSWDLGDDATHGLTCPASSVEDAIGKVVAGVLHDRQRRGGSHGFAPSEPPRVPPP